MDSSGCGTTPHIMNASHGLEVSASVRKANLEKKRFSRGTALIGAALAIGMAFSGCHSNSHPDNKAAVYTALEKSDLMSVTVSQDQDAGVITLNGIVGDQARKDKAQQVAQQAAPGYRIENNLHVDNESVLGMAKPGAKAPEVQTRSRPKD